MNPVNAAPPKNIAKRDKQVYNASDSISFSRTNALVDLEY